MLWRRARICMRQSEKWGGVQVGSAPQANATAYRKALRQERAWWVHPLLPLTHSATIAMNQSLSPGQDHKDAWARLVPSIWPILIDHLSPTTFVCQHIKIPLLSQRFYPGSLLWSGIYLTSLGSHLLSSLWHLPHHPTVSVCELHEGKG